MLINYLLAQTIKPLSPKNVFSCASGLYADIKDHWAHSHSGYYTIATSNGDITTVYCRMKELRKSEGAWARIAYLNCVKVI